MIVETPHPLWQASNAWRMTITFPVQSLFSQSAKEAWEAEERDVQGIIEASISDLDEVVDDAHSLLELHRVNKLRRTKLLSPLLLAVVRVDGDDARSLATDGSLDHSESDGSESEDGDCLSFLYVRRLGPALKSAKRREGEKRARTLLRNPS
jgi:hypothetical protein